VRREEYCIGDAVEVRIGKTWRRGIVVRVRIGEYDVRLSDYFGDVDAFTREEIRRIT
jgi:hypothetical protein